MATQSGGRRAAGIPSIRALPLQKYIKRNKGRYIKAAKAQGC